MPSSAAAQEGTRKGRTKRGACRGKRSKISWTQVETGSSITWKYPSCILQGDDSVGEFYSVALSNNHQQADTGTKMIHIGKNTRSTIISKGISAGHGKQTYRGLVRALKVGAMRRSALAALAPALRLLLGVETIRAAVTDEDRAKEAELEALLDYKWDGNEQNREEMDSSAVLLSVLNARGSKSIATLVMEAVEEQAQKLEAVEQAVVDREMALRVTRLAHCSHCHLVSMASLRPQPPCVGSRLAAWGDAWPSTACLSTSTCCSRSA